MAFPVAVVRALLAHGTSLGSTPSAMGTAALRGWRSSVSCRGRAAVARLPPALEPLQPDPRGVYHALDSTSKADGYPVDVFLSYAIQGLRDGLDEQASMIRDSQMAVTWENYVHERFRDEHTPARSRQKQIALALSPDQPTPVSKIRYLTPVIAEGYAGKTSKTVTRDLHELEARNLVRRRHGGVIANVEVVRAFLSRSVDPA